MAGRNVDGTGGRRIVGAVAGGLVAGLGITALPMMGERKSGVPSELAQLERSGAAKLGFATPPGDALPLAGEQVMIALVRLLSCRPHRGGRDRSSL